MFHFIYITIFIKNISNIYVGFVNPGSLVDWLPRKGSTQADSAQLMGQPKYISDRPEE